MKTNKIKVVLSLNKTTVSRYNSNGSGGMNKSGQACEKKCKTSATCPQDPIIILPASGLFCGLRSNLTPFCP